MSAAASLDSGNAIATLLVTRRILVVAGTGGVGKTTVAAALAVEAARRGRKVLALTIDPARRLCDALGIEKPAEESRGDAQPLAEASRAQLGIPREGALDTLMLDMKSTFDGLVHRFAEGDATKARIFDNPIYQHVSDALAGSAEYAAMEKVYELAEGGRYDLIVLDTPPSQHALDFLEAPRRLVEFLDSRLVNLLVHPAMAAGRFGFKLFHRTSQRVLQAIERISGVGFLEDISEFLLAIDGMSAGFRDRATNVRQLLLGPKSAFLVVAGPSPQAARSAFEFLARMRGTGVPVEGVLMNRVRLWPDGEPIPASMRGEPMESSDLDALARALAPTLEEGRNDESASRAAARAAVEVAKRYASLVQQDHQSAAPLREHADRHQQLFACIPELPRDVCDLDSLSRVGDVLFRGARLPATSRAATGGEPHGS
jgi:anion-transporting  ArsA/GET3 family ATPase